MASEAKRYLDKSSEGSGEVFPRVGMYACIYSVKKRVVPKFTWSRDQVYLEWWPRVLLGVQGSDGGGRVLARWISKKILMMRQMKDLDEEEVSDDEEMTQVKVLITLADDELSAGKNHACNGEWINITMKKVERLNPDNKLPNFNTERILVPDSQVVNECLLLIEASADLESSS
ncbi:hypothetical protein Tco_0531736 [Tanacetum coccineum]